jgi:hypothetical protein
MAGHYVLPKLLIACALLQRGLSAEAPSAGSHAESLHPLPRGVAEGAPSVDPLNPDQARGQIVDLFAEIRSRHGYDEIADYFRGIARAGDFLRVAWNALRPIVGDPEFYARAQAVTARAVASAHELAKSAPGNFDLPLEPPERNALAATVEFYLTRLLPETLVDRRQRPHRRSRRGG